MSDQPPEKNNLLKLLKTLWLPVTGFVGAVTLVYNFYQSWRGDQATFTYILSGVGLLVLMIALAWVGFKPATTVKLPFLSSNDEPLTKDIPAYSPIVQYIARLSLILVFVLGLFGIGVLFQRRQALQNKLVVLIATFQGPEEVYGLRNEIIEKLNADFPNNNDVEIIKINDIITPNQGSSYAHVLGQSYLADIVLWGWYRPTQNPNITIHIENLSPDQALPLDKSETLRPIVTLSELETFSFQEEAGQETSALISFIAGFIQYKSDNYSQALIWFDDAVRKIPNRTILLKNQADIYSYRGYTNLFLEYDEQAITDFSMVIQLDSQNAESYSTRGFAYAYQGKYDESMDDYSKAIQLAPENAQIYSSRGTAYFYLEQYDLAINDYSKAIKLNSQDADTYSNRGSVYYELKKYDLALLDYSEAIKLNPQNANAYNGRGIVYTNLKKYDLAISDYSRAIEIDSQLAFAYNNRGNAYMELKKYNLAISDYSKAITISEFAAAYYNRGLVYSDLEQYDRALDDFSRAIEIYPKYASAYDGRGTAYASQEKYKQAIADFSQAVLINPQFAKAYYNCGLTYYYLKQYEDAIVNYSKAIQIAPELDRPYRSRGNAYKELGRIAEAEADFAKYKELTGQDP